MRLLEFQYIGSGWNLNPIQFQPVNLIVGKNAVGKSRLIKGLSNAVQYIVQATDNKNETSFGATFVFSSGTERVFYHFSYINGKVALEKLFIEKKIPADTRDRVPVIADEQGVLGIYGIGPNLGRCAESLPAVQIRIEDIEPKEEK